MSSYENFGDKSIVFGGDIRQTLPIIFRGTKDDIIQASIIMSPLWNQFEKLKFTQNMRAMFDPDFSSYLLKIGDGVEDTNERDEIQIPSKINLENSKSIEDTLVEIMIEQNKSRRVNEISRKKNVMLKEVG
ncbi:hypothetical protein ACS0TY_006631 [Phlomoides rotata]